MVEINKINAGNECKMSAFFRTHLKRHRSESGVLFGRS